MLSLKSSFKWGIIKVNGISCILVHKIEFIHWFNENMNSNCEKKGKSKIGG